MVTRQPEDPVASKITPSIPLMGVGLMGGMTSKRRRGLEMMNMIKMEDMIVSHKHGGDRIEGTPILGRGIPILELR